MNYMNCILYCICILYICTYVCVIHYNYTYNHCYSDLGKIKTRNCDFYGHSCWGGMYLTSLIGSEHLRYQDN